MRVTITLSNEMCHIIQQHMERNNTTAIGMTNNLRIILEKFARIEGYSTVPGITPRGPRRKV